jgi:hypothetical protein
LQKDLILPTLFLAIKNNQSPFFELLSLKELEKGIISLDKSYF